MRRVLSALICGAGVACATGALAQAWPEKPVRFVVGFTPGGPSDILARALGQKLAELWAQQVVIENRPGAGGNIAAEVVAKSAPDGTTWLLGNNSILATNQSLYAKLGYDPAKDFAPVALVAIQPNILVVNPSVPASSVRELIALAKAKPGALNYASSGSGAAAHLAGELFKAMTGVDMVHVPYKGAQPALTDVIAGQAQLMFATSASVIPYIKAGRLRALAVTTSQRSGTVPELPTVSEAGVPGFEAITWHGVVVPVATIPAACRTAQRGHRQGAAHAGSARAARISRCGTRLRHAAGFRRLHRARDPEMGESGERLGRPRRMMLW
jgi:tripartite-type tricarboxylate transporter receptor subunit TctC